MDKILPPLAAVRVFEAAARHLNFTRAAGELAMTQAAVSYQIKVLEERVGKPLFIREGRRVSLTEAGALFSASATEAMRVLADGYEAARTDGQTTLSITTIPAFAANWLALRLGTFQIAHPNIAVRVDTSSRIMDLARDGFDVAIRSSPASAWPGLDAHFLFNAGFTPMLSPALAASIGGVKRPEDVLKLPIIDAGDPWWAQWFDLAGIDARADLRARPRTQLGSQAYEGRAAIAGLGVAILTAELFAPELATGALVQPFDIIGNDGYAYWLLYRQSQAKAPKVRAFRDWMLTQMEPPEQAQAGSQTRSR